MIFIVNNWRWLLALVFLSSGFIGFMSGVGASERDITESSPLTLLYYSMGLFILGGLDLGVPLGGPLWGRVLVWIAYFGAPLLTTSALMEWLQVVVANPSRWLRNMRGHTILVGINDLSRSVMDKIDTLDSGTQLLVVERDIRKTVRQELEDRYGARCLAGDFTDQHFLQRLRINRASRVVIASENDYDNFETASKLLEMRPEMGERILLHCNRLRYLRAMAHSDVVQRTHTFNCFQLAGQYMVRSAMMEHFLSTEQSVTVVLAGFGRFGQTVLEELQEIAASDIATIVIIDVDAHRRVMVAEEQVEMHRGVKKHILQGEIGHPEVWQKVSQCVDLSVGAPLVLMATGRDEENLRTGTWFSRRHPNARVLIRSQRASHFAQSVSQSMGILTFNLQQVFQDALPDRWLDDSPC